MENLQLLEGSHLSLLKTEQEGDLQGRLAYVDDLEGSNSGGVCRKHLMQGRHWIHKRLLPVSMVRSCGTGGVPMEKLAMNCIPDDSAMTGTSASLVATPLALDTR